MPPVRAKSSNHCTQGQTLADLGEVLKKAKTATSQEGDSMGPINSQEAKPQPAADAAQAESTTNTTEEGNTMNAAQSNKPHQDAEARATAKEEATDVAVKINWRKVMKVSGATAAVGAVAAAGYFAYKHFFGGTATVEVPAPGFFK